jgi:hypothetical protein
LRNGSTLECLDWFNHRRLLSSIGDPENPKGFDDAALAFFGEGLIGRDARTAQHL